MGPHLRGGFARSSRRSAELAKLAEDDDPAESRENRCCPGLRQCSARSVTGDPQAGWARLAQLAADSIDSPCSFVDRANTTGNSPFVGERFGGALFPP